jgi:hypothetical protein
MSNLGIYAGTITDNNAVILDEDSTPEQTPYLYGSVYNNATTTATVTVQINTVEGLRKATIPLNGTQGVKFKRLQLHSIQSLDSSPNLNYVFSVSDSLNEGNEGGVEY